MLETENLFIRRATEKLKRVSGREEKEMEADVVREGDHETPHGEGG